MFKMEILFGNLTRRDYSCNRKYDNNLDDYRSVLADLCDEIHNYGHIKFYVSGFGEEEWPVDCRIDLLVIVEQLPQIINKITDNSFNFALDFYEQGIERELIFEEESDYVQILCKSRTHWKPNPDRITMSKSVIKSIFYKLYSDFISISHLLCNELVLHPLLKDFIIEQ